jgi:glycosyltransferase involved in cell wall biosynthesis
LSPKATYVFDMVDFHYLRLIREWEINKKQKTLQTANRYLEMELNNCEHADRIALISNSDKLALTPYDIDLSKAEILSNVHQHIKKDRSFMPFEKRNDLLFIGGFKHAPNEDAVLYLRNKIMPKIWEVHPNMVMNIIGSYPTDKVLQLDSKFFKIHGFVDDVTPYFKSAKAFVAPLRYGAGIKGKIGQSLEFSLPVITTDVGAEGFDFSPYNSIMIANDSETFIKNLLEVISNKTVFDNLSNHAETILKPFSIMQTEENLLKILSK